MTDISLIVLAFGAVNAVVDKVPPSVRFPIFERVIALNKFEFALHVHPFLKTFALEALAGLIQSLVGW